MAATDSVAIVHLQPGDAAAALALSTEAQWNQNEADWRFFLASGIVFGIVERDVGLIATAALLPYAQGNAWISMVLVTASRQRRGLATRLVDACIEEATRQSRTAWLDATPAGAAVYGGLGFTPTGRMLRMRHAAAMATKVPLLAGDFEELVARDGRATGFDRRAMLQELCGRDGSRLVAQGGAIALIRDGRSARHVGPLLADDAASAARLLAAIVQSENVALLTDVNGDDHGFIDNLTASGWSAERPFQRMRFVRSNVTASAPAFAGAGPEYG
ncbi:GNAT family N-acetyltransferase [Tardiphaga sp. vice154]|uniref:GNAT family N-acetyltransferase n=1 Tax=Tardiphaga sp. vice154 TaxID=2592814 RepID=UPI0011621C49|nr:GNAT family N-acetyltransferase [Tardiphaga sp. vice154]QDM24031.1 GNAT family N-acetyltransferase [Tardiphaga sp. vice154]